MRSPQFLLLLVSICSSLAARAATPPRHPLTRNERLAAQTAIERVYDHHRIWPKENPSPKPPFEQRVPAGLIERKAVEPVRMSAALLELWNLEITPAMLQAELERMERQSRNRAMLHELFAALGDDPAVIAETLVRGVLAERALRERYGWDARLHAETRKRAEAIAVRAGEPDWTILGGEHHRQVYLLVEGAEEASPAAPSGPAELPLERDEFAELPRRFSSGQLEESPDGFTLSRVLERSQDRIEVETIRVAKRSFDDWWAETAPTLRIDSGVDGDAPARYTLPGPDAVDAAGCDMWDSRKLWSVPDGRRFHSTVWTGSEMIIWGGIATGGAMNSGGRYNPATDSWQPTSTGTNVPGVNYTHKAVWTGTEMIVWGAFNNTGGRYNPASDSWQPTSTGANNPTGRSSYSAVWTGTYMIIWGGDVLGAQNNGGRYNPATDTWLPVSTGANVPIPRYSHTAVWTGGVMIVWGGTDGIAPALNNGGRYDPVNDSWLPTFTGANVPAPRLNHSAIWTGSRMIVWGGDSNGSGYLNSGGRYDPATDSWLATSTGASVPAVRTFHSAVWTGIEMIVWGGSASGDINTGGRYNPSGDSWTATSTGANVPSGRALHSAVWSGSEMVIWGGNNSGVNLNTGGRYTPSTNSWVSTSLGANVPTARYGHRAVWTGSEMIVWGGIAGGDVNTGGRYTPATDSWVATSTGAGVPTARSLHTAVWTGSVMVVWGGGATYLNSGGRYSPVSDGWLPTSTSGVNLPQGRNLHTAVWAGSEMIIWGGAVGSGLYTDTGGRYEPVFDNWAPVAVVANTPSPRQSHAAVWTGGEMIVWGGYGGAGLQNTGGRYAPAGGAWAPVSVTTSTPTPRHRQTAVWTGSEMVVWGGMTSASAYANTGGRYNPSTDLWSTTSTGAGVPAGRHLHSAVWTGDEMIIWGGSSSSTNYLNSGGRYLPATNAWTTTSTGAGVPSGRNEHSTVWTGSGMIVWGGRNGSYPLNNGGIYGSTYLPASPGNSLRLVKTPYGLNWSAASGATSYNVRRCSGTCIPAVIVATPATNSYSEPLDANGYFYAVEAVNACGATP